MGIRLRWVLQQLSEVITHTDGESQSKPFISVHVIVNCWWLRLYKKYCRFSLLLCVCLHVCVFRDAIGPGHLYSAETLPHHQKCPGAIQWTGKVAKCPSLLCTLSLTHRNINRLLQEFTVRQQYKFCCSNSSRLTAPIICIFTACLVNFLYISLSRIYWFCSVCRLISNAEHKFR